MAFAKEIMRKIVSPASHLIKECAVKCFNYIRRKRTFEQVEEGTNSLKNLEQEQRKKTRTENYDFGSNSMEIDHAKNVQNSEKEQREKESRTTPTPISIAKDYMGAESRQHFKKNPTQSRIVSERERRRLVFGDPIRKRTRQRTTPYIPLVYKKAMETRKRNYLSAFEFQFQQQSRETSQNILEHLEQEQSLLKQKYGATLNLTDDLQVLSRSSEPLASTFKENLTPISSSNGDLSTSNVKIPALGISSCDMFLGLGGASSNVTNTTESIAVTTTRPDTKSLLGHAPCNVFLGPGGASSNVTNTTGSILVTTTRPETESLLGHAPCSIRATTSAIQDKVEAERTVAALQLELGQKVLETLLLDCLGETSSSNSLLSTSNFTGLKLELGHKILKKLDGMVSSLTEKSQEVPEFQQAFQGNDKLSLTYSQEATKSYRIEDATIQHSDAAIQHSDADTTLDVPYSPLVLEKRKDFQFSFSEKPDDGGQVSNNATRDSSAIQDEVEAKRKLTSLQLELGQNILETLLLDCLEEISRSNSLLSTSNLTELKLELGHKLLGNLDGVMFSPKEKSQGVPQFEQAGEGNIKVTLTNSQEATTSYRIEDVAIQPSDTAVRHSSVDTTLHVPYSPLVPEKRKDFQISFLEKHDDEGQISNTATGDSSAPKTEYPHHGQKRRRL